MRNEKRQVTGQLRLLCFDWTATFWLAIFAILCGLHGCSDAALPNGPAQEQGQLLSAFFGLDNELPATANLLVCDGAAGLDGMPVVFSEELADLPQPENFRVTGTSGALRPVKCTTFDPADDPGERRTVLLAGEFGAPADPPVQVSIVGDVRSLDGEITFDGAQVAVTPLSDGPSLVLAQSVPRAQWALGDRGSLRQWGGGDACPKVLTQQVIRVTWNGGVRLPDGGEVTDLEGALYTVALEENGQAKEIRPFKIADLNDRDNNHALCLAEAGQATSVRFPAGVLIDPNGDLNPQTVVLVTPQTHP